MGRKGSHSTTGAHGGRPPVTASGWNPQHRNGWGTDMGPVPQCRPVWEREPHLDRGGGFCSIAIATGGVPTERSPQNEGWGRRRPPHNGRRGRSRGPAARTGAPRRWMLQPPASASRKGEAAHPRRAAGARPPPLTALFLATILSSRRAMRTISSSPPIPPLPAAAGPGARPGRGSCR